MSDTKLTIEQKIAIASIAAEVVGPATLSAKTSISLDDFPAEFDAVFTHICEKVSNPPGIPSVD